MTVIISDNPFAHAFAQELQRTHGEVRVFQSALGRLPGVPRLDVGRQPGTELGGCGPVISLHCRQIFPPALVRAVRCVNVHPGYNPINRGWFPHVFSMIAGTKAGVTIHEMDDRIDHGPIIVREECPVRPWDTSKDVYDRLLAVEQRLLAEWYERIRDGRYTAFAPEGEGNINYQRDYAKLLALDLDRTAKLGDVLTLLRALTHGDARNAYFIAPDGTKVFVRLHLEPCTDERPAAGTAATPR